jgi:hypothetical protein
MLTRRTFFASLAALAVSPRVAPVVAAPVAAPIVEWKDRLYVWQQSPANPLCYIYSVEPRRDDGRHDSGEQR